MVKIPTLNELSKLADSQFNQPPPRHGLNLLYWFAQQYGQLDPESKVYGFHRFHNRIDDDDDRLLPNQDLPYYEVGNLNAPGAEKLPSYVKPKPNSNYYKASNKDRIIVRLDDRGRIGRVYVTEHEDQKNFDIGRTYRVSLGLLDQISRMERTEFLKGMQQRQQLRGGVFIANQANKQANKQANDGSWCTIL